MYRPTVRYADIYKTYIDSLFRATTLDRNQIIRAALFAAAFSPSFESILDRYRKKDVPLPQPLWEEDQHELWMEQNPNTTIGGKDVNANDISETKEDGRKKQEIKGQEKIQERGKTLQPEGEKIRRQDEEKHHKEKALDTRTLQRSVRKVHNNGGITIRIG